MTFTKIIFDSKFKHLNNIVIRNFNKTLIINTSKAASKTSKAASYSSKGADYIFTYANYISFNANII